MDEEPDIKHRIACMLLVAVIGGWPTIVGAVGGDHRVARADRVVWLDTICQSVTRSNQHRTPAPIPPHDVVMRRSVTRVDRPNGSTTLHVTLTGDLQQFPRVANGYDCVWIDSDGDGRQDPGEPPRAYVARHVVVHRTKSGRRAITFDIEVPRAAGKSVCGRSYRVDRIDRGDVHHNASRSAAQTYSSHRSRWQWTYSQKICTKPRAEPPAPPAEVPEAPLAPMLAISAAATGAISIGFIARRRSKR